MAIIKRLLTSGSSVSVLDSCDSLTGWSGYINGIISLNTTTFTQGTGAINLYKTAINNQGMGMRKTVSSFDGTDKYISFWYYIKDNTVLDKIHSLLLQLYCPNTSNFIYKGITKGSVGWNRVSMLTSTMSPINSPNLADIRILQLIVYTVATTTTIDAGDVIVDYWGVGDTSDEGTGEATWVTLSPKVYNGSTWSTSDLVIRHRLANNTWYPSS